MNIEAAGVAKFTVAGWRQPDGTVRIDGTDEIIPDWPAMTKLLGFTYNLQQVVYPDPPGKIEEQTFEHAEYF